MRLLDPDFPKRLAVSLVLGASWFGSVLWAQNSPSVDEPIESLADFWLLSATERETPVPLKLDLEVLFYDPAWNVLQVRDESVSEYILPTEKLPIRSGDRVLVAGFSAPAPGTFSIGEAEWQVTERLDLEGTLIDVSVVDHLEWVDRLVTIEGLAESQVMLDDEHLEIQLLANGVRVMVWLSLVRGEPVPQWQGQIIRVTGVYAPKIKLGNEVSRIEFFSAGIDQVESRGGLDRYELFELPIQSISEVVARDEIGQRVKVSGRSVLAEDGSTFWLQDESGVVEVITEQTTAPSSDQFVEIVGAYDENGVETQLRQAVWRPVSEPAEFSVLDNDPRLLHRVARTVLELPLEQAAEGHGVQLSGIITWSQPGSSRVFIQDGSGGVELRWAAGLGEPPESGESIGISGVSVEGDFAPAVAVESWEYIGREILPRARVIRFEQAAMGLVEAQWVKLTGFVFEARREGEFARLGLSTATGEISVLLSSTDELPEIVGSVVAVSGVCVAQVDETGTLAEAEIWVPQTEAIEILDSGATDHFEKPITALSELGRFDAGRSSQERIHTMGRILHWDPMGRIYVTDGSATVRVHSRLMTPMRRGDRVDLVGFLGLEDNRTMIREAVYRVVGNEAIEPAETYELGADLSVVQEGTLVEFQGILVESFERQDRIQFSLRNGAQVVLAEISLEDEEGREALPNIGTLLRVTGVWRVGYEDNMSRALTLLGSSLADVEVIRQPTWWSPTRVTTLVAFLVVLVVVALVWVRILRQRVRDQRARLEQQLRRSKELEADLQRTSRMESMGSLAEGISRDFRGLLDRIESRTGSVMETERLSLSGRQSLDQARASVLRARDLTLKLGSLSLAHTPELQPLSMREFLEAEMASFEFGSGVRIATRLEADLAEVPADRLQLRDALRHIFLNASQAMPTGGTLRVRLSAAEISSDESDELLPTGTYQRIDVEDTGNGIAPEHLDSVFDPYFTTRSGAKGLGLSVVFAIVRQHRGRVVIKSAPSAGTTVSIWLRDTADPLDHGSSPAT